MKRLFFSDFIRQLYANPLAIRIVRRLHLGAAVKNIYYRLFSPKKREKCLSLNGIEANFWVNDFEKLRAVETVFEPGDRDERKMLLPLLQMLKPGDVAYDVGASLGVHTIFMAKKVGQKGQIYAFEPADLSYDSLRQNIALNNLNNIIPVQVALGDRVDEGILYLNRGIGIGAVSLERREGSDFCQKVKILPGDSLVQSRGFPFPKAVKIDVEGYEFPVIKGLQKTLIDKNCRLVCCEIHPHLFPDRQEFQMIVELLKSLGFQNIKTHNRGSEIQVICHKGDPTDQKESLYWL